MRTMRAANGHLHGAGHLGAGGALRCGCATEPDGRLAGEAARALARPRWSPVRRQLTGFVRTRFIYSDRLAGLALVA